jgi:hypothetical protein
VERAGWDQDRLILMRDCHFRVSGFASGFDRNVDGPLLDPEELVDLVDLAIDGLSGIQRHQDQLHVFTRPDDAPEIFVFVRHVLHVDLCGSRHVRCR